MHHIHFSTPALFVLGWLILGLIIAFLISRSDKRRHELTMARLKRASSPIATAPSRGAFSHLAGRPRTEDHVAPGSSSARDAAAPTVIHSQSGGSGDMLTGVLLGSMLGGHHDTTVHHTYDPAPACSAPASDGGFSFDSGSSSSSDSAGGFTLDW